MTKSLPTLVFGTGLFILGMTYQQSPITDLVTKFQTAKSMTATISAQEIGGPSTEVSVAMEKPYRVLSATKILVRNQGENKNFEWNRTDNTVKTGPLTDEKKALAIGGPEVFGWTTLFFGDAAKEFTNPKVGAKKKIRGIDVTPISITIPSKKATAELFIDPTTGYLRGYTYAKDAKQWIVWATKFTLSDKTLGETAFTVNTPADVKVEVETDSPKWADVSAVFNVSCMPCHGSNMKGGVDLRTYESTIASGVKPGDAEGTAIYKSVKVGRMPKGGKTVSADQLKVIENWIKAGAKK